MDSKLIQAPVSGRVSQLVKAAQMWYPELNENTKPNGMFGRKAYIDCNGIRLSSDELDFEFSIPFDDDIIANEAEITIYNLSNATIKLLSINSSISVTAGYGDDVGMIFKGRIDKIGTKKDGVDRITTIKAIDDAGKREYEVKDISFASGTKASYILKQLLDMLQLNIAVFSPNRDYTYTSDVNVSGGILGNIKKYAEICGISVYINKGMVYARKLTDGDNVNFTVSTDTGLISSPEEFEEENDITLNQGSSGGSSSGSSEKSKEKTKVIPYKGKGSSTLTATERANAYITAKENAANSSNSSTDGNNDIVLHDIVHGYNIRMLLQYHINTAAIINISSSDVNGVYRVRKGTHIFNDSECVTECEVVDKV